MKKIISILILIITAQAATAQQLARARNVQLVTQPGTQLVMKGGINFIGTAAFTHKGTITLLSNPLSGTADWLDSTTNVMNASSAGKVVFKGNVLQQVYGPTRFDSLTVQNNGINLRQSNEVRQNLDLANGLVYFTSSNDSIYVANPALSSVLFNADSLATSSWVNGKLSRRTNTNSAAYFFPIGKMLGADSLYAPVRFEKQNTGAATYSAQYFPSIPFDRTNKNPVIDHISSLEYWEITSHTVASSGDDDAVLSLSWRDYGNVNALALIRDSLLIAHYYFDGAVFQWQPEFNFLLPNNINGTVNFGYIKSNKVIGDFSMPHLRFTIGTRSPQNLLPLTLLEWKVVKQNRTALCSWTVADDRDVDIYQVERAADGLHFSTIGTLPSRKTAGNSTYTFTDLQPLPGMNYYRLKSVGNGLLHYSVIRNVRFDKTGDWIIYPNPATDIVHIQLPEYNGSRMIRVYDAAGKIITVKNVTGNLIQVNITALANGIYYMELLKDGRREVKSFIKN